MDDTERLNWLAADSDRLEDVRGWLNNNDGELREAIDALAGEQ